MPKTTDFIAYSRDQMVKSLDGLTTEQINQIPDGFNNNLIWNLAHVVSVQQGYLYGKAGLTPTIDATLISDYGNGTFPKDFVDQAEIDTIKQLALSTVDKLQHDIEQGTFANFPQTTITAKAIQMNGIDDALEFILFHEGLHLGTVKALHRAVTKQSEAA